MDTRKFAFREARDTLIDMLLGAQGTTYPLTDLPVRAEHPVVLYNNAASILVSFSQPDVGYAIYQGAQPEQREVSPGNHGELSMQTHALTQEDYTFHVTATKSVSGNQKRLLQIVTIKVGINSGLAVIPQLAFFPFATTGTLTVRGTQSGALYQLLDQADKPLSEPANSREGGDLDLVTTGPLKEDVQVKVKVTNIKTGLGGTLEMQPTLRVSPNTALIPTLQDPVSDYNGNAIINLENTQETVAYQLLLAAIDDDDPEQKQLEGSRIGEAIQGTGSAIALPVAALQEDLRVQVLARKIDSGREEALTASVFIPVRPDAGKKLTVLEKDIDPAKGATIKVAKTQKGILYQLRGEADEKDIGRARYHHKNYGIGKARIGIEFALDLFTKEDVYLPTGPLAATTTFQVLAIKATTRQSTLVGTITVEVKQ